MIDKLQQEFAACIRTAMDECHAINYHPTRIEEMLRKQPAHILAAKLVTSGTIQTGLMHLKSIGRIDLSFEMIMLQEKFKSLFSPAVLEAAKWRAQAPSI